MDRCLPTDDDNKNHISWMVLFTDVKNLVQDCVGGPELQQTKQKIQSLSETVSSTLKKHVYENYMQFIETAKEISRKRRCWSKVQHETFGVTFFRFH